MSKRIYPYLALFFITIFCACGGTQGLSSPSQEIQSVESTLEVQQAEVDAAFLELGDMAWYIFFPLKLVANCYLFDTFLEPFESIVECSNGGRFTFALLEPTCEEQSNFYAEAGLTLAFDDCLAGEIHFEGSVTTGISLDDSQIAVNVSSPGVSLFGIQFAGEDISVTLDDTGRLACDGKASLGKMSCEISNDCSSCELEE